MSSRYDWGLPPVDEEASLARLDEYIEMSKNDPKTDYGKLMGLVTSMRTRIDLQITIRNNLQIAAEGKLRILEENLYQAKYQGARWQARAEFLEASLKEAHKEKDAIAGELKVTQQHRAHTWMAGHMMIQGSPTQSAIT
jgi:hypothetical protein